MNKKKKPDRHQKVIDDTIKLPDKQGNGILKYSVSVDAEGKIARYSMAYINHRLCHVDNCRVLGYDNCHGYHHKHDMGKEEAIEFVSFEDIATRFENEWRALHETINK
jgi:hypothetical protein